MATLIFGGQTETVNDWPEGLYEETIIRVGTLVYLVSTGIVPTWGRDTTGGPFGTGNLVVVDGGYEITRGPDYADVADMLANAPDPGTVRWCFDGATYIRLGSEPAFEIRVGGSTGYAAADGTYYDSTALLAEAGLSVETLGRVYVSARYIDDPSVTYLDVLNDSSIHYPQSFGFNRLGQFQADVLASPTGDPVYTFTLDNVLDVQRVLPDGMPYPMWRMSFRCAESWPISQVASGAEDDIKETLQKSGYFFSFIHEEPDTLDKHLDASELTIETKDRTLVSPFGFSLLKDRWFALFGVEREQITVEVQFDGNVLQLDCNDVVSVTMPRFGLDAGKLFRVIAVRYDLAARRCDFTLWG